MYTQDKYDLNFKHIHDLLLIFETIITHLHDNFQTVFLFPLLKQTLFTCSYSSYRPRAMIYSTTSTSISFLLSFSVQQCMDIFGKQFNSTNINAAIDFTNTNYGGFGYIAERVCFNFIFHFYFQFSLAFFIIHLMVDAIIIKFVLAFSSSLIRSSFKILSLLSLFRS